MRQNPHVRICGGPGSATTLVYPTPSVLLCRSAASSSSLLLAVDVRGSSAFDGVSVGSRGPVHHDAAHSSSVKVITHGETASRVSMERMSPPAHPHD